MRALRTARSALGVLAGTLLVACGTDAAEAVVRAEGGATSEPREPSVAPHALVIPGSDEMGARADETLGRVLTRGGVVEVGLAFEGRVRQLLAGVGQPVAEGSVLAEVEVPELAVAAAEAVGLERERRVLSARHERVNQLVTEGLAPRELLDGVEAALAELETRREVALSKLRSAHVQHADQAYLARHGVLRMRAPREGVVVELLAVEGGAVGPGAPLGRLVGPSEAVVQVTTAQRPPGGPVSIVADDVTLTSAAPHEPVLDPQTGLFHTFYPLTEALPHGARVTVRFAPRRP